MTFQTALFLTAVFLTSFILTGFIRRWAIKQMLDHPNERSSHTRPTPRGGGIAIVIAFLGAAVALTAVDLIQPRTLIALLGGVPIAIVGFLDDRRPVSSTVRAGVHFIGAAWAVIALGGMPPLDLGFAVIEWGIIGHVVAIIGIVWMINLYNFMDGIDGIAAGEAVTAPLFGGLFSALSIATVSTTFAAGYLWLTLGLVMACAGFLVWNWNPARIFMGDVGSGFLGFTFSVIAILSITFAPPEALGGRVTLWVWLILLAVFIVDATITLARRVARGERWFQAHRTHAYQKLVIRWADHARVTRAVLLINLFWLMPLAFLALIVPSASVPLTIIALIPLIGIALYVRAGVPDTASNRQPSA